MLRINKFVLSDIVGIVNAFQEVNWRKPISIFETYLHEQQEGKRKVWVAYVGDYIASYVTLKWQSSYEFFVNANIPEIIDLNVLPMYRNQGIGSKLLEAAESEAATEVILLELGLGYMRAMMVAMVQHKSSILKEYIFQMVMA